ncbi:MAG: HDOD domain-containing protein [Ghiorsea sp.]
MLYFLALLGTIAVAYFIFRPKRKKRIPARRKVHSKSNKPTEPDRDDFLLFDFSQGAGTLSVVQPVSDFDTSATQEYREHLNEIPALPSIWSDLLRAIKRGDGARKVARLIKNEPTLAVEVLRCANSISKKDINDLGQAIVLLGYNTVQGIVSSYCFSSISPKANAAYSNTNLWKHAIATSALATIISKYIPGCDSGVAGTLGLLHDLGRIGINAGLPKRIQKRADPEQGYLCYEREVFGCSHIEAGVLLAKHWELPDSIQDGILYHHHPAFADPDSIPEHIRKEVFAVYLADMLAIHFEFHGGHHFVTPPNASFTPLMNASLQEISQDNNISKELWRVKTLEF